MVVELGVSIFFPSHDSVFRCRPLLRGIPWVGSPTSSLLLRHSDFPTPPLCSLALRSAVSSRCDDDVGISQVPGQPLCTRPALRPRWSLRTLAFGLSIPVFFSRRFDVAFRSYDGVGLHNMIISGLYHAAHTPAVYASQPRLPVCFFTATQDSLPDGGPAFPVGTFTLGLLREVSVCSTCYITSSSPKLCLAHHR